MPPANPAEKLLDAPISDLTVLLLKQFMRLMKDHNITLTTPLMESIGAAAAKRGDWPPVVDSMRDVLAELVKTSEGLLKDRWNLSYAEALQTDMNSLGNWETTAEFLEIANEKNNAELRISAGSSLLALLDDGRYVHHLLTVIDYDAGTGDVDGTIARRALCHLARVDPLATDWLEQARAKLN